MPSRSFEFERVTRIAAGAIGPPGKRRFVLQVRAGGQLVSLAVEKQQLLLLAERLQVLLANAGPGRGRGAGELALEEPIETAWRIGSMTLAYDEDDQLFEVRLVELAAEGEEPATGRFRVAAEEMRALARHAVAVVAAGRPPCPVCGGPIDHDGGICPRLNGHHV